MHNDTEKRLAALEAKLIAAPCDRPGHDARFMFVFTGRNGNEREVEAKMAEIRNCEQCGENAQFFMFIFGEETMKPAAPTVAGWDGLELN